MAISWVHLAKRPLFLTVRFYLPRSFPANRARRLHVPSVLIEMCLPAAT
jgi:hypothetical protein